MKTFVLFLLAFALLIPALSFSQAQFQQKEYYTIVRSADSTAVGDFLTAKFNALNTKWGTKLASMTTYRVYMDSVCITMRALADSACFTVKNQYGYTESASKTLQVGWFIGAKMAYFIQRYRIEKPNNQPSIRTSFVNQTKYRVYITYF